MQLYLIIGLLIVVVILLFVQNKRLNRIESTIGHLVDLINDGRIFDQVRELLIQVGRAFPNGVIDYIPPKHLGDIHAFQVAVGDRVVQVDVTDYFTLVWWNETGQRQTHRLEPSRYRAPERTSIRNELLREMRMHLYGGAVSEFAHRDDKVDD